MTIEDLLSEDRISYSLYSVIRDNLYNDIKNKNEISKYVIGLLLEMSHMINNTTNKSIVLSQLLEQTEQFNNLFSNTKEISNIMLNEPSKIHHKQLNKIK